MTRSDRPIAADPNPIRRRRDATSIMVALKGSTPKATQARTWLSRPSCTSDRPNARRKVGPSTVQAPLNSSSVKRAVKLSSTARSVIGRSVAGARRPNLCRPSRRTNQADNMKPFSLRTRTGAAVPRGGPRAQFQRKPLMASRLRQGSRRGKRHLMDQDLRRVERTARSGFQVAAFVANHRFFDQSWD